MAVLLAVLDTASALGKDSGLDPWIAFRAAFRTTKDDPMVFEKVYSYNYDGKEYTDGAVSQNYHLVQAAELSQPIGFRTSAMAFISARNNMVHELGHVLTYNWSSKNLDNVPGGLLNEEGWPESPASANITWRQHPSRFDEGTVYPGEVFADMFLGRVYNKWGAGTTGDRRREYITDAMNSIWDD